MLNRQHAKIRRFDFEIKIHLLTIKKEIMNLKYT